MAVSEFGLVIVKTIRQRSGLRTTPRYAAATVTAEVGYMGFSWQFNPNQILGLPRYLSGVKYS